VGRRLKGCFVPRSKQELSSFFRNVLKEANERGGMGRLLPDGPEVKNSAVYFDLVFWANALLPDFYVPIIEGHEAEAKELASAIYELIKPEGASFASVKPYMSDLFAIIDTQAPSHGATRKELQDFFKF